MRLYARARQLLPSSFYRFLAGGIANTVISYGVYFVLLQRCGYLLAYDIAYAFGLALSFTINGRYVFGGRLTPWRGLKFCLVNFAQYVYQREVLWILVEGAGLARWLALVLSIGSFIPFNYALTRLVFRGTFRADADRGVESD